MHAVRPQTVALSLVAALLLALALAAPAGADPVKPYSLTIAPSSVPGSSTVTMTATFSVSSTASQGLGSANLTPPSGFRVVSPAACPSTGAGSLSGAGTACVDSAGVVELRNLGIPIGGSDTLTMSVTTPACAASTSVYSWSAIAKQANNFNGTGNNLGPATTSPNPLVTTVDCGLAWGTQPHDALIGQHITGAADNQFGPPLTVQVLDNNGQPDTTSSEPVTVAINANPASGTLSGTKTVNASNGVATFSDLSIDKPGTGYTLGASAPGGGSATSNSFNESGTSSTTCTQKDSFSDSCNTSSNGSSNSNLQVTANGDPNHPETTTLSIAPNLGTDTLNCSSLAAPSPNWYAYEIGSSNWSKTVVHTERPLTFLGGTQQAIVANENVCEGATIDFVTKSGALAPAATLPDGTPGFIGDVPNCGTAGATVCIPAGGRSSKIDLSSPIGFDLVVTVFLPPPFDSWGRCC
jgi:hypothetical protein